MADWNKKNGCNVKSFVHVFLCDLQEKSVAPTSSTKFHFSVLPAIAWTAKENRGHYLLLN